MEVTRQLRVDRVTKTGLAPIMLTCWWDNQRLRLMPGEKYLPKALTSTKKAADNRQRPFHCRVM